MDSTLKKAQADYKSMIEQAGMMDALISDTVDTVVDMEIKVEHFALKLEKIERLLIRKVNKSLTVVDKLKADTELTKQEIRRLEYLRDEVDNRIQKSRTMFYQVQSELRNTYQNIEDLKRSKKNAAKKM